MYRADGWVSHRTEDTFRRDKKKQPVGLLIEKNNQNGTSITVFRIDKPSTEYLVFCPAFVTLADGMPNV